MDIRHYNSNDEVNWVRCRVLAILEIPHILIMSLNKKEKYQNHAIELVAIHNDQVVGLLDIEYEEEGKQYVQMETNLVE